MNADESELLKSAIEFHDLDVSDILTPRVRVDGVDGAQLTARTDGGRLVRMPGDPQIVGSFRQVRIVDSTTWSLVGQMEEAE